VPSAVVHGVVPLLLLLAIRRFDARKVWVLWPLTFAPDLDYLVGLHRAALTNVFVLVPFVVGMAWAWRTGRRGAFEWWLIAFVYLASHLVMDTFPGATVPLWPLSDYTVCYTANIVIHTPDNSNIWALGPCSHAGLPQVATDYLWLDDSDSAMLAFLVPAALVASAWAMWRGRRERSALVTRPADPETLK